MNNYEFKFGKHLITYDERQFLIKKKNGKDNDGNDVFTAYVYFSRIENLLKYLMQKEVKQQLGLQKTNKGNEFLTSIEQAIKIYNEQLNENIPKFKKLVEEFDGK